MNSNLINLIPLMFFVMLFTSILAYKMHSYKSIKHKVEKNVTKTILIQWVQFIKKLLPDDYKICEKYGIWRYLARFKIEMMF